MLEFLVTCATHVHATLPCLGTCVEKHTRLDSSIYNYVRQTDWKSSSVLRRVVGMVVRCVDELRDQGETKSLIKSGGCLAKIVTHLKHSMSGGCPIQSHMEKQVHQ